MKSKIFLPLLLAVLAMACAQSFVSVQVPFLEKKAVDFSRYQNVYFIDFITTIPEITLDADAENKRVFCEELSFVIDKKITYLDPPQWAMIRKMLNQYRIDIDIKFEDSVFFQKIFQSHPGSLFVAGKLKIDIKKMGVVKEVKDEKGDSKNVYAAVQLWEMEMKISIIDGDSGQLVLQKTYTEKMEPGEATSPQFNFNGMLAKMTAKLGLELQPRKVTQERYILRK